MTNSVIMILSIVIALAIAAVVVHGILTWMERRGWIFYRTKNRPRPSSLGLIEEIYQPSIEHVTEQAVTDQTEAESEDPGELFDADG